MGLDICIYEQQEGERVGAYSMFHSFRQSLMTVINTSKYIGTISNDKPFYELLNHSDCDGELTYSDCLELSKDFKHWHKQAEDYAITFGDFNFLSIYDLFMKFVNKVLEAEEGKRFIQFC